MIISKPSLEFRPLSVPRSSDVDFGLEVYGVDAEDLSGMCYLLCNSRKVLDPP